MKKSLIVLGSAAMVAAAAVPALAFENEFHGMFRTYGYMSNVYQSTQATSAGQALTLKSTNKTVSYFEQRARLQYIAKANDDLKLVTHFEIDSLFGGGNGTKYQTNDTGGLDADAVTLETKNVYLDFNVAPPVNVKVGIQPFSDAYQGVFGNFDGSGVMVTGKFGILTKSLGWFRVGEDNTTGATIFPGKKSNDLLTLNAKAAVSKELTVGASYYYLGKDTGTAPTAEVVHTLGVDASVKAGPAAVTAFGAYQFGDFNKKAGRDLGAYALGAVAKVKAGPGNVSVSGLYLSGEKTPTTGDFGGWQQLNPTGATTSYFSASNMWLLIRNGATINTSTSIGGNDLTKGGRGLLGAFAGFDAAMGKTFFATNLGYAQIAEKRAGEKSSIGTELNATVGHKLYDNLAISLNGAYALLGDGANKAVGAGGIGGIGVNDAKDPYATFVRVDYTF